MIHINIVSGTGNTESRSQDPILNITSQTFASHSTIVFPTDPASDTLIIRLEFAPANVTDGPTPDQWRSFLKILASIPARFTTVRFYRNQKLFLKGNEQAQADLYFKKISEVFLSLPSTVQEIDCLNWNFAAHELIDVRALLKARSSIVPNTVYVLTRDHIPLPYLYWHDIVKDLYKFLHSQTSICMQHQPEVIDLIQEVEQLKAIFVWQYDRVSKSSSSSDLLLAALILFAFVDTSINVDAIDYYTSILKFCINAAESSELDSNILTDVPTPNRAVFNQFIGLVIWHVYNKLKSAIEATPQDSLMQDLYKKLSRFFENNHNKTPNELIAQAKQLLELMKVEIVCLHFNPQVVGFSSSSEIQPGLPSLETEARARESTLRQTIARLDAEKILLSGLTHADARKRKLSDIRKTEGEVAIQNAAITHLRASVAKRMRGQDIWGDTPPENDDQQEERRAPTPPLA